MRGDDPRTALTILTATSVIASHPSTEIIEKAVESLCKRGGVARCRHLIVCDGCAVRDHSAAQRYAEYKVRLCALVRGGRFCTDVEVIELPQAVGLPGVILAGIARIRTPYVLVYEHDWVLARRIDTRGILRTLSGSRTVQYIRLNKRRTRETGWEFVLKPDVRTRAIPLVRSSMWSANPHFAKMAYYRRLVLPRLRPRPGEAKGFEEPLSRLLQYEILNFGFDRAQRRWGVFVYGRLGDPALVHHLDGRTSSIATCRESS
jgi:hypothetical protein